MKKLIVILSVLLSVQLGLAIGLDMTGKTYGTFEPKEKLLAFDMKSVDGLRIQTEKEQVELRRQEGKWMLPESDDFPANQTAVNDLLEKLAALQKGWPVATTSSAASHFKVAKGNFERKLTLLSGDKEQATLYVGTSPGFRKVNVRSESDDNIYTVAFNTWEVNPKPDDWIDKEILKLDEKQVKQIEMPNLTLQRKGDTLQLADLDDKEMTNEQEAKRLMDKLTGLPIKSLLGSEVKPEWQQDKPSMEIKLTKEDGKALTYRFSKPKTGNDYILKRSDLAPYFMVAGFEVDQIKAEARNKLVEIRADEKPGMSKAEPVTTSATDGKIHSGS
jgi:hypothetical protein